MKGPFRLRQILLSLALMAAAGCSYAPAPVVTMTSATAAKALAEQMSTSSPAAMPAVEEDEAEPPATETPAVRTRLHEKPALVNVRPEPGTTRAPIAVLKGGKVVEVLEEQGGWLKIRWLRKTGEV